MKGDFQIRALTAADRPWVERLMDEQWGGQMMVRRGGVSYPATLPGFAAFDRDEVVGLVTWQIEAGECELASLDSLREGIGVGAALVEAVTAAARLAGCARVWLITTNDNTHALRFYQKRGFTLAALYPNAVTESRKVKPSISLLGNDGIPLRDELELELILRPDS